MKSTRADDETTLEILRRYVQGETAAEIAAALALTLAKVRARIRVVVTEDCLTDAEAEAYWRANPKGHDT